MDKENKSLVNKLLEA